MMGPALVRREPVGRGGDHPVERAAVHRDAEARPGLAAGRTVVLKPAPETPLDAVLLAEALMEAEIPAGVVNILPTGREVGEYLVKHPGIDKVSFTGSTAAGRRIASLCGEQLKRVTLELGGKSAAIILDDADLDSTIAGLLPGMIMNNGQACVAQTRVLASRKRYKEVGRRTGDGARRGAGRRSRRSDDDVRPAGLGAPAASASRATSRSAATKVRGSPSAAGARRRRATAGTSSRRSSSTSNNKMRIAQEEIFGPVAALIPYDDEADALRIANDSDYGLSGTVWTADVDHGVDVARQVRTGTYTVNSFSMEFSAPFGGFKCSGIGRELGPEGLSRTSKRRPSTCRWATSPKQNTKRFHRRGAETRRPSVDFVSLCVSASLR
jgi:betaine-aldehyde dehydrogenase